MVNKFDFRNGYLFLIAVFACCFFDKGAWAQQQIGGYSESGGLSPREVSASSVGAGPVSNNVNLFDGRFSASYSLGSVATPGGLKFDLSLVYSSSFTSGPSYTISSGIPYGEGWNLNLPSVSVSVDAYSKYSLPEYCNKIINEAGWSPDNTPNTPTYGLLEAIDEGDLYWFSPQVSIPGVGSGRAVFKYVESGEAVFVMSGFEDYIELRLKGSQWHVILSDGTVYEFSRAVKGFRNPTNNRIFNYPTLRNIIHNWGLSGQGHLTTSQRQALYKAITPQEEYISWYVSRIYNRNIPSGQTIMFDYEEYGKFNFYKEYEQLGLNEVLKAYSPMVGPFYPEFTVAKDIFLKRVKAVDYQSDIEMIELEYEETYPEGLTSGFLVPDPDPDDNNDNDNNNDVYSYDKLYNYKTVYVQGNQNHFNNWRRYRHGMMHEQNNLIDISESNPYLITDSPGDSYYYLNEPTSEQNHLSFNHGFLESPRIFTAMSQGNDYVPGDLYEIRVKTNRTGGANNCGNLDINIATGQKGNNQSSQLDVEDYRLSRGESAFTTFHNAIKWNTASERVVHLGNNLETSNMFVMPDFPQGYQGFNIQIGPANSDNNFKLRHDDNVLHDPVFYIETDSDTRYPTAYNSYNHIQNGNVTNYNPNLPQQYGDNIPHNFGVGLPWSQTLPFYISSILGVTNFSNDDIHKYSMFDFWWVDNNLDLTTTPYEDWENRPTMFDENVKLTQVELVRYSKKPYMLKKAKKYKVNGVFRTGFQYSEDLEIDDELEEGWILVKDVEMNYEVGKAKVPENNYYSVSIPEEGEVDEEDDDEEGPEAITRNKNVFLLSEIIEHPTNTNTEPLYEQLLTTHFEYETFFDTQEDFVNKVKDSGLPLSDAYLLRSITDNLGGMTEVEFHTIQFEQGNLNDGMVFPRYARQYSCANPLLGLPGRGNQQVVEIVPLVKTLSKTTLDENGNRTILRSWDYEYEGRRVRPTQIQLTHDHFRNNFVQSYDFGFLRTTVFQPELEDGSRPYTEHLYYGDDLSYFEQDNIPECCAAPESICEGNLCSDIFTTPFNYHTFGKLFKVKNFDGDGKILNETENNYEIIQAFENGIEREFIDRNVNAHNYMDYIDGEEAAVNLGVGFLATPIIKIDDVEELKNILLDYEGNLNVLETRVLVYEEHDILVQKYAEVHQGIRSHPLPQFHLILGNGTPLGEQFEGLNPLHQSTVNWSQGNILMKIQVVEEGTNNVIFQEEKPYDILRNVNARVSVSDNTSGLFYIESHELEMVDIRGVSVTIGEGTPLPLDPDNPNDLPEFDSGSINWDDVVVTSQVDEKLTFDNPLWRSLNEWKVAVQAEEAEAEDYDYSWMEEEAENNIQYTHARTKILNLDYEEDFDSRLNLGAESFYRGVKFYENRFYHKLQHDYEKHSYFVKLAKNTYREFDHQGLVVGDVVVGPTDPLGETFKPMPAGSGFINNHENDDEESLIDFVRNTSNHNQLRNTLLDASPLSEPVLLEFTDRIEEVHHNTTRTVLLEQPALSNEVLVRVVNSSLNPNNLKQILTDQPYLADPVLFALVERDNPLPPALIINVFENQDLVYEGVVKRAIERQPGLPPAVIRKLTLNQDQVSTDLIRTMVRREHNPLPPSLLRDVLTAQPVVTDSMLIELIEQTQNFPNGILKHTLLNVSPYPSDVIILKLMDDEHGFSEKFVSDIMFASPRDFGSAVLERSGQFFSLSILEQLWELFGNPNNLLNDCGIDKKELLSIERITEYDYYDANYDGTTTSSGFKKLFAMEDADEIRLYFEPSWQVYSQKSYSPQTPGAFTKNYSYYYYDLFNRYLRLSDNMDSVDIDHMLGFNEETYEIFGSDDFNKMDYEGIRFSRQYGLRNLKYQITEDTKNSSDEFALSKSVYMYYDNRWNDVPAMETTTIAQEEDDCEPIDPDVYEDWMDDILYLGCGYYKLTHENKYEDDLAANPDMCAYWFGQHIFFCNKGNQDLLNHPLLTDYECAVFFEEYTNPNLRMVPLADVLGNVMLLRSVVFQADTLLKDNYLENRYDEVEGHDLMEFVFTGTDEPGNIFFEPVYPYDTLRTRYIHERNRFGMVQLEEDEKGLLTRYKYDHMMRYWHTFPNCLNYMDYSSENIGVPLWMSVGDGDTDSLTTFFEYNPNYTLESITYPNDIEHRYSYDMYNRLSESFLNGNLIASNRYSNWNNDLSLSFEERSAQNFVDEFIYNELNSDLREHTRSYVDPLGREANMLNHVVGGDPSAPQPGNPQEVVSSGQVDYDVRDLPLRQYKNFIYDFNGTPLRPLKNTEDGGSGLFVEMEYEMDQRKRPLKEAKFGETLSGKTVDYRYNFVNYHRMICDLQLVNQEIGMLMPHDKEEYIFIRSQRTDEDDKTYFTYKNTLGQKVAERSIIDGDEEAVTLYLYDSYGNLEEVINPKKQSTTYEYNILGWLYRTRSPDAGESKFMYNRSGQVVISQDANGQDGVTYSKGDDNTIQHDMYYRVFEYDMYGNNTEQYRVVRRCDESSTGGYRAPEEWLDPVVDWDPDVPEIDCSNITVDLYSANMPSCFDPLVYDSYTHGELVYSGPDTDVLDYHNYVFSNASTFAWLASVEILVGCGEVGGGNVAFVEATGTLEHFLTDGKRAYEKRFFYNDPETVPDFIADRAHPNAMTMFPYIQGIEGNLLASVSYANDPPQYSPINYAGEFKVHDQNPVAIDLYSYDPDGRLWFSLQQFNQDGITEDEPGLLSRLHYADYNLRGGLKTLNVDINNDEILDAQYHYKYDGRGRLHEVYFNYADVKDAGTLLASYEYDDALGLKTKKTYHYELKDCDGNPEEIISDQTTYAYDDRDRLNTIENPFFDYYMFYDGNQPGLDVFDAQSSENYNGNINGIAAKYKLDVFTNAPDNFDHPTVYSYHYDGINRLTKADGTVGDHVVGQQSNALNYKFGDTEYSYDVIGNIEHLKRYGPYDINNPQDQLTAWNYNYEEETNRLSSLDGLTPLTDDRTYSYDANGNLLSDSYRGINELDYGRANLPFNLNREIDENKNISYLYDASDARIFKCISNGIGCITSEYYLRDAMGNEIGIRNNNNGDWEWYVFGNERFAKVQPEDDQLPEFYTGDEGGRSRINEHDENCQALEDAIHRCEVEGELPDKLVRVQYTDGTEQILTETELEAVTDEYTLVEELYVDHEYQQLLFTDTTGARISVHRNEIIGASRTLPGRERGFKYQTHPITTVENISFYLHDHLGNTRVVYQPKTVVDIFDITDESCLTTKLDYELDYVGDYYPYGKTLREFIFEDERYITTHHERDRETDWDFRNARYSDADIGRFLGVDPMAHVAPGWSPYRAFYCNPIRYIDPTGMLEDDYGLDKQGNITLLRKTDDPTDKLIALDNDGNETDKSIEVDKGILSSKKTNTVTASNGKDYTFDQYKIKGDDKAKGLFEFVADNTEVEWSLTGVGAKSGTDGQNILTTSHIKDSEIGGGYLKAYGYTIRKHSHSHPNNKFPSTADKKFAESLNLKFPKATLDIYHKGEYFQYDKNGLISVPTIVLPEIEIKVPKN